MPYSSESKEKKTDSIVTERDDKGQAHQWVSQGGAGASPSYEWGDLLARVGNDRLFAYICEAHLQEAQEFRLKGYNSQVPEVDAGLLTQLRDVLAAAKSRLFLQASVREPLGSLWLQDQIGKIELLTGKLSDDIIKSWVEHEVPGKSGGEVAETALGSRRMASRWSDGWSQRCRRLYVLSIPCALLMTTAPRKNGMTCLLLSLQTLSPPVIVIR
jgi:hypothetical protein